MTQLSIPKRRSGMVLRRPVPVLFQPLPRTRPRRPPVQISHGTFAVPYSCGGGGEGNLSVRSSPISTHLQRKLTIKSLIYWSDQQTTLPVNGRIWEGSQRQERKKCISISHTKVILQFYVQRFSSGAACTRRLWFASYVHVQHLFIICWPSTWTWTGIEI